MNCRVCGKPLSEQNESGLCREDFLKTKIGRYNRKPRRKPRLDVDLLHCQYPFCNNRLSYADLRYLPDRNGDWHRYGHCPECGLIQLIEEWANES